MRRWVMGRSLPPVRWGYLWERRSHIYGTFLHMLRSEWPKLCRFACREGNKSPKTAFGHSDLLKIEHEDIKAFSAPSRSLAASISFCYETLETFFFCFESCEMLKLETNNWNIHLFLNLVQWSSCCKSLRRWIAILRGESSRSCLESRNVLRSSWASFAHLAPCLSSVCDQRRESVEGVGDNSKTIICQCGADWYVWMLSWAVNRSTLPEIEHKAIGSNMRLDSW